MKLAYCNSKSTVTYVIYQNYHFYGAMILIKLLARRDYSFHDHNISNVR